MRLKLSQIRIDGGTQPRDSIDQTVVSEYNHSLMNGAVFPPVEVFFDGINYYLADGFHRYFAHKSAVSPDISVNVHTGTLRDAILYSVSANDKHGLRRSIADKRKAVMILLRDDEWKQWSNTEIAKRCNVSTPFVIKIREEMYPNEEPQAKKYTTKHGTVSTMKPPSKPKEKEIDEPVAEIDTEFDEDDKLHELQVSLKDLAEENTKLSDRLAVQVMDASEEEKKLAEETIDSLRKRIKVLEAENDALRASVATYMTKNAEMVKQLQYYKRRMEKIDKAAA